LSQVKSRKQKGKRGGREGGTEGGGGRKREGRKEGRKGKGGRKDCREEDRLREVPEVKDSKSVTVMLDRGSLESLVHHEIYFCGLSVHDNLPYTVGELRRRRRRSRGRRR